MFRIGANSFSTCLSFPFYWSATISVGLWFFSIKLVGFCFESVDFGPWHDYEFNHGLSINLRHWHAQTLYIGPSQPKIQSIFVGNKSENHIFNVSISNLIAGGLEYYVRACVCRCDAGDNLVCVCIQKH